uniref:Uncharacterized protein n=1 Tax=Pseudo-nitzschia australis TaxID=44445 RepID=A0A7S4AAD3_9STRA|mmetsp:Transcript_19739/g.42887  ORF Transcript_19739/g.42887 Transcript_19739/m.42887 type:complete len:163 (-) Transcript_19739:163-651(-)|eukprot:CAMPEP_0168194872 /NCGR_PEP_ID=MMETSP0139_2-20121125/19485_1 /TAXON_ID=44445 /ORGANISM="Pseudo-nitzschia australis, Strain 10249 10 AB" /LENGTH=162 /DNA_ID=CAMNT_0008118551 /DNA_START=117 /DNA_END=605 /DNA_ORIENTATION=+
MTQNKFIGRACLIVILFSLSILENACLAFAPTKTTTANYVGLYPAPKFTPTRYGGRSSVSVFDDSKPTSVALAFVSPDLEAEVLTTMAHATMDFSGFFAPSKSVLRLYSVVGRIFVISADYITDHSIQPEELAIQLFLLGIAVKELIVDNTVPARSTSNQTK